MKSSFGTNIRVSIFGESHSPAIGLVMEGLPAGFKPDLAELHRFMQRRAPGNSPISTPRKETDEFEILSGMNGEIFSGAPFSAIIRNTNINPSNYSNLENIPRPGHADFTAEMKFKGAQAKTGGGHFSGRLTAVLCLAGGIALQILKSKGIFIGSHIFNIGKIYDSAFDDISVSYNDFDKIVNNCIPVIDNEKGKAMTELVLETAKQHDSIGGSIECACIGLPPGIGNPMFMGLENRISSVIFGIPAVKGIEFGAGFGVSEMTGSENNDAFTISEGKITTVTNNHGGILGGISSGMPLIFRVAVKPTPSIFKTQQSVDMKAMKIVSLDINGRHDPCIVPRAVPCVEAATALAILDAIMED